MLRIPAATDRPPPLVVPLRQPSAGQVQVSATTLVDGRRRKRKSRHGESHSWDSSGGHRRSHRGEKRQMFWMLVGGATVLAMVVAGVLMAWLGGGKPVVPVAASRPAEVKPEVERALQRSDASFLSEAEPMARKFLEAGTIAEIVPLVRNPRLAEQRLKALHPDGRLEAPGMSAFNTLAEVVRSGSFLTVNVRTREQAERALHFVDSPEGIRIDWESWAGWSAMSWQEFQEKKPVEGTLFRVKLSAVDYYNTLFADETKWQSHRLISPDGAHALYGYAERDSLLNSRLRLPADTREVRLTLYLKYPPDAVAANQVLIESLAAEGWVLPQEESP